MSTVIVLGGCGAVGRNAVKTLVKTDAFTQVRIGDINETLAGQMASELGLKTSAVQVDVTDPHSIRRAIDGCDLVLNCVGPFYNTVKTIIDTVISAGINYVDVCDDPDVTLEILDMHEQAVAAGITVLLGMGASPGVTNLLAKMVADDFLDTTESIDIFHTHGGEPMEGEGVIGHRFHCMSIDIPMFLEGGLKYVKYFEEDGMALRQTFNFPEIGDDIPIFPYPHPEQLTLPRYIDVKQVTNKGSVLPIAYYELTAELCRLGVSSREPIVVKGNRVVPYDFAVAFLISEREKILKQTAFGHQRGAMSIVVKGHKNGNPLTYRIHTVSMDQALGEGTGIPAAVGAILVQEGKVTAKGVFPPEGCIRPADFIERIQPLMKIQPKDASASGQTRIIVEEIDATGQINLLNF